MNQIKTEYLVLAPMIPMVVHIYSFFAAFDHWLIAAAVAVTFDFTIFMLFRYLRAKEVRNDKVTYRAAWLGITLMTLFQLYVNIRVYWQQDPGADAVAMGTIFPLMFGFLSFISARMQKDIVVVGSRPENNPVASNEDNRETCQRVFSQVDDKTDAVNMAVDEGVPRSSAYRYFREYKKKGSLL